MQEIKSGDATVIDAKQLRVAADQLEASLGLMHGSAFAPALRAVRLLHAAAKQAEGGGCTSADGAMQNGSERSELVRHLRTQATTVPSVPSKRMIFAAERIESMPSF